MLDEGDGDAVVCMHGVPASSFLYRKLVPELAARDGRPHRPHHPAYTIVDAARFRRPWSMEPFARRGIAEVYLGTLAKPACFGLFRLQGARSTPRDEVYAYVELLKREDRGRAFVLAAPSAAYRLDGGQRCAKPLNLNSLGL